MNYVTLYSYGTEYRRIPLHQVNGSLSTSLSEDSFQYIIASLLFGTQLFIVSNLIDTAHHSTFNYRPFKSYSPLRVELFECWYFYPRPVTRCTSPS